MHGQPYKVLLILSIEFRRARIGVRGGFNFVFPFLAGPHQGRTEQAQGMPL